MSSDDFASLLPMPASRIRAIDLRIQCGANLAKHWRRLRRYGQAAHLENPSVVESFRVYPPSSEWCDAMLRPFDLGVFGPERRKKVLISSGEIHLCPSATVGNCHYAMNPSCKPDSLQDMVLLFETKGGWNKHSGPELFTFDNHDPKGGCVLLNDGTVKFIRTAEQLRRLRWK
ncbi:MAG TPA: hypothetical protein ENI81_11765 [Phycisphaerales bacterium]|nr:hypothetical protein [Phycisphaerales bacterium]